MAASTDVRNTPFRSLPARLASGLLLAGISVAAVWVGGWVFILLLFLVLMTGLWEFLRMGVRGGYPVLVLPGLLSGAAVFALAMSHDAANAGLALAVLALWMMGLSLRPPLEGRLIALSLTLLAVVYVMGLGMHLLWLREMDRGLALLIVVLLGTWAADTFAYFVGSRFGRNLLAPAISPGKTVEGFVGGIGGAILVVVLFARWLLPEMGLWGSIGLGLVVGILSPIGDLIESMFKRNLGIKDTSRVIPGHGGVLDRIDSLLVTAPVAYYLSKFLLS